jgi:hypothetical protein
VKTKAFLMSLNLVESAVSEQQGASFRRVYTQRLQLRSSAKEIESALKVIDALCTAQDDSAIKMRGYTICEKLHTLKGDLKTMKSKESLSEIVKQLDSSSTYSPSSHSRSGGPLSGPRSKQSLFFQCSLIIYVNQVAKKKLQNFRFQKRF